MTNPYRKLRPRHWVISIVGALALVALREWFEPGYFLVTNILTVVLAVVLALIFLARKRAWACGLAAFVLGIGWHALEAWGAVRSGDCLLPDGGWFSAVAGVDACMDYTEDWVIPAQALLIAGAVVLIFIVTREVSAVTVWWRREQLFVRLRNRR